MAVLAAAGVIAGTLQSPAGQMAAQDTNGATGQRIWANKPSRLTYGNYCGFGTRYGTLATPPVNDLDQACQLHDACYIAGNNHCLCDSRLVAAAQSIAADTALPRGERLMARTVIDLFSAKFCKLFPHGVFPRRNPEILKSWFPPAPPRADRPERE